MVLPGSQPCRDDKTGYIGGRVPLNLKGSRKCNRIKMLQGKKRKFDDYADRTAKRNDLVRAGVGKVKEKSWE